MTLTNIIRAWFAPPLLADTAHCCLKFFVLIKFTAAVLLFQLKELLPTVHRMRVFTDHDALFIGALLAPLPMVHTLALCEGLSRFKYILLALLLAPLILLHLIFVVYVARSVSPMWRRDLVAYLHASTLARRWYARPLHISKRKRRLSLPLNSERDEPVDLGIRIPRQARKARTNTQAETLFFQLPYELRELVYRELLDSEELYIVMVGLPGKLQAYKEVALDSTENRTQRAIPFVPLLLSCRRM